MDSCRSLRSKVLLCSLLSLLTPLTALCAPVVLTDTHYTCVKTAKGEATVRLNRSPLTFEAARARLKALGKKINSAVQQINRQLKKLQPPLKPKAQARRDKLLKAKEGQLSKLRATLDTIKELEKCKKGELFKEEPIVTTACGNKVIEAGEECDDGNLADGDCCSLLCKFEAAGSACGAAAVCSAFVCDGKGACNKTYLEKPCDDENPCTINDHCQTDTCVGEATLSALQSCGLGICTRQVVSCENGASTNNVCTPGTPGVEVCNGEDDDCNGLVDEGFGETTCGEGACRRTAVTCLNGALNTCVPGAPSVEVCDGADNNCNGETDEGLNTSVTCGVGACRVTVTSCASGVPQTCKPKTPGVEVCNGIDDDCDGKVDEDLGEMNCGGLGACAIMRPRCVGGVPQTCDSGGPLPSKTPALRCAMV